MRNQELSERTKRFAVRIIRLFVALPQTDIARVIGKQLLRSGTSVGANYREATRARSDAELISKLSIAEQELDETLYWLELLGEANVMPAHLLTDLQQEADELIRIVVASIKTLKGKS